MNQIDVNLNVSSHESNQKKQSCYDSNVKVQEKQLLYWKYHDKNVRIINIDGNPWWIAKDVSEILEYSDTQAMTRRLDEDDVTGCTDATSGQDRELKIINEYGLYDAVLGCKKPDAKHFKRWITHTVLPQIFKTGSYSLPNVQTTNDMATAAFLPNLREELKVMNKCLQSLTKEERFPILKDKTIAVTAKILAQFFERTTFWINRKEGLPDTSMSEKLQNYEFGGKWDKIYINGLCKSCDVIIMERPEADGKLSVRINTTNLDFIYDFKRWGILPYELQDRMKTFPGAFEIKKLKFKDGFKSAIGISFQTFRDLIVT